MNRYIVRDGVGDLYFVYADTELRVYQLMAKVYNIDEEDLDHSELEIMKTDPNVEVMKIEFKE